MTAFNDAGNQIWYYCDGILIKKNVKKVSNLYKWNLNVWNVMITYYANNVKIFQNILTGLKKILFQKIVHLQQMIKFWKYWIHLKVVKFASVNWINIIIIIKKQKITIKYFVSLVTILKIINLEKTMNL